MSVNRKILCLLLIIVPSCVALDHDIPSDNSDTSFGSTEQSIKKENPLKVAQKQSADRAFRLSFIREDERRYPEALKLLTEAADQSYYPACLKIGKLFAQGSEHYQVKKDRKKAARYLSYAAANETEDRDNNWEENYLYFPIKHPIKALFCCGPKMKRLKEKSKDARRAEEWR
ncbi:MAG: hypothetical protein QG604_487 [Candidatus Dependentiae bacterium]|nr:hypothetical protein [Candidatus Dependentiae bacterium]